MTTFWAAHFLGQIAELKLKIRIEKTGLKKSHFLNTQHLNQVPIFTSRFIYESHYNGTESFFLKTMGKKC
jgi:hypothetical protein